MAALGKFACKTIGDSAHSEPAEPRDAGVISKFIDKGPRYERRSDGLYVR